MTTICHLQVVCHQFDCGLCDFTCTIPDSFIAHTKQNHKTFLPCKMCNKIFSSPKTLINHINTFHQELSLRCGTKDCNFVAAYVYDFREHIVTCNGNGFICIYCNSKFNTPECLIFVHWKLRISTEQKLALLRPKPVVSGSPSKPVPILPSPFPPTKPRGLPKPIPVLPSPFPPTKPRGLPKPIPIKPQRVGLVPIAPKPSLFSHQTAFLNNRFFSLTDGIPPSLHGIESSVFSTSQHIPSALLENAEVVGTKLSDPISICPVSYGINRNALCQNFPSEGNHIDANKNVADLPSELSDISLDCNTIRPNKSSSDGNLAPEKHDPAVQKSGLSDFEVKSEQSIDSFCSGETQLGGTAPNSGQMAKFTENEVNSKCGFNPIIKIEPVDGEIGQPNDDLKQFSDLSTVSSSINTNVKPVLKLLKNIKVETLNCSNEAITDTSNGLDNEWNMHSTVDEMVDLKPCAYSIPSPSQLGNMKSENYSIDNLIQMSTTMKPCESSQQACGVLEKGFPHFFSDRSVNASSIEANAFHAECSNDSSSDSDNNLVIDEDISELQSDLRLKGADSLNPHKQISALESDTESEYCGLRNNEAILSLGTERRKGWASSSLNIIQEESSESSDDDDVKVFTASAQQPSDESIVKEINKCNTLQGDAGVKCEKECKPGTDSNMQKSTNVPSKSDQDSSRKIIFLQPLYLNKNQNQIISTVVQSAGCKNDQSELHKLSSVPFQIISVEPSAPKTSSLSNHFEFSHDRASSVKNARLGNAAFLSESNMTVHQILRKFKYQRKLKKSAERVERRMLKAQFDSSMKHAQAVQSDSCILAVRSLERAPGENHPEIVKLHPIPSEIPNQVQNKVQEVDEAESILSSTISQDTQRKFCEMPLNKVNFSSKKQGMAVGSSDKTSSGDLESLHTELNEKTPVESTVCKEDPNEAHQTSQTLTSESKLSEGEGSHPVNDSEFANESSGGHKTSLNSSQIQFELSQKTCNKLRQKGRSNRSLISILPKKPLNIQSNIIPVKYGLLKHIPSPSQSVRIANPKVSIIQSKQNVGTLKFMPHPPNLPIVWLPKDRHLPPVLFSLAPKSDVVPIHQSDTTSITNTVSTFSCSNSNANQTFSRGQNVTSSQNLEAVSHDKSGDLDATKSYGDTTGINIKSYGNDCSEDMQSHSNGNYRAKKYEGYSNDCPEDMQSHSNGNCCVKNYEGYSNPKSVKSHISEANSSMISAQEVKLEPIFQEQVQDSQITGAASNRVEFKSIVSPFYSLPNLQLGNKHKLNVLMDVESVPNYLDKVVSPNHSPLLVNSNMQYFKYLKQLKSSSALKAMAESTDFFKCMFSSCTFTSNSPIDFENHSKLHGNVDVQCSYCLIVFSDSTKLVKHSIHCHYKRIFQCSLCFYRACSKVHVASHLQACHKAQGIVLTGTPILVNLPPPVDCITLHIDVKAILCSFTTCQFLTRSLTDMIYHIWKHSPCLEFSCFQCEFQCHSPLKWIAHLGLHDIFLLHCFYCSFGCNKRLLMLNHLTIKHADYPLMMYVRTSKHLLFTLECLLNANENVEFKYIQNCSNPSHCYCYLFLYHAGSDGDRILQLLGNIKTKNMHFKALECLYCFHKSTTTASMEKHLKTEHCPLSQLQYYSCVSQPFSNSEILSLFFAVNREQLPQTISAASPSVTPNYLSPPSITNHSIDQPVIEQLTDKLRVFLAYIDELKMCVMQHYFAFGQVSMKSFGTYTDLKILLPLPESDQPSNISRRIILSFHNVFTSRRKTFHFLCEHCSKHMRSLYELRVHWKNVHVQRGKRFLYHVVRRRMKHKSIKFGCRNSTMGSSNSSRYQEKSDLDLPVTETRSVASSNLISEGNHLQNNSPLCARKRKFYSYPCDKRIFKKRKLSFTEPTCSSNTVTSTLCISRSPKCSLNACKINTKSGFAEPQKNSHTNFQVTKMGCRLRQEMSELKTPVFLENYACLMKIPLRYLQSVLNLNPSVLMHNAKDDIMNDLKKYYENVL